MEMPMRGSAYEAHMKRQPWYAVPSLVAIGRYSAYQEDSMFRRIAYYLAAAALLLGVATGAICGSTGTPLAVSGGELIIERCSSCG
jgi:hypothetical protein